MAEPFRLTILSTTIRAISPIVDVSSTTEQWSLLIHLWGWRNPLQSGRRAIVTAPMTVPDPLLKVYLLRKNGIVGVSHDSVGRQRRPLS